MTGIYTIRSLAKPERVYVGSAVMFWNRMKHHVSRLRNGKHCNIKLQRHVDKYGVDDLVFKVVHKCEKSELIKLEQHYIDTLKPYFNIQPTAGSNLGMKFGPMKEYHKQKIAKALTGRSNQKAGDKLAIPVLKYDLNGNLICRYKSLAEAIRIENLKIKISKGRNKTVGGFVWATEKMNVPDFAKIKKSLDVWKKVKMKPVLQIDKNGNVVSEFGGVREAARVTNIDHRSIQSVAAGNNPKRKTAGGFIWQYKERAA